MRNLAPVGHPSGWEELAAYYYKYFSPEGVCKDDEGPNIEEIVDSLLFELEHENWEVMNWFQESSGYDWRVET